MAPSRTISRENSMGTASGRTVASAWSERISRTGSSLRVEQDPDVESGRWSFIENSYGLRTSAELVGVPKSGELMADYRKSNAQKFGSKRSTHSATALDVLAAGLDINCLPFFDITVKKLTYKVSVKTKDYGAQQKTIINNVCAEAYHGQIMAVVGPSGSGKTTFLDALAGRIDRKSLHGEMLVNGEALDDSFNRISGYVMQDDALFPHLTVRETLLYSARLRISGDLSMADKRGRVESMITTLGLKQCADTRVGNEKVRGVSGGERRRVSIGADLIHDPAVLFLDEPTSGLDSTSALNVMQKLSRMAQTGRRTVILTIHQPSYRILETIDRVLVLGQGNVIFHGRHSQLRDHFNSLGRTMPEFVNVIEYALDTIEDYQRAPGGLEPLVNLELRKTSQAIEDEPTDEERPSRADGPPQFATSVLSETIVLADRNFKNICRTPELFLSRSGLMVVVALTMGTLFLQVGISNKGERQRCAFMAFSLALIFFTSTESMGPFIEERHIFIRETSRGAYRTFTYVFSGAIVMLPFLFFLALLYSTISYWLVGLAAEANAFIFFVFIIFGALCTANSFVIFFSGLVPNFTIGLSLVCAAVAYFFLFSGFFIERKAIPMYWIWLHYISLFKYPYECLIKNEFDRYPNTIWFMNVDSQMVLDSLSAGHVHYWVNICAMIGQYVGYRVLFWVILRFFTKGIRK